MDALCAATFRLQGALQADCEFTQTWLRYMLIGFSFAFVEYESRRDADDAYHEMHNKRIGRDDLLKIEVRLPSNYLNHA